MRDYLEDIVPNNVTKERMESLNALLNDLAVAGIHGEITFDAPENHPRELLSGVVELRVPQELRYAAYDIIEEKYVFTTSVIVLSKGDPFELKGITFLF